MMAEVGRLLLLLGVVLVALGGILMLAGKVPWLGKLPGDISYKGEPVSFYFPLATCFLLSGLISLLLYLFRR